MLYQPASQPTNQPFYYCIYFEPAHRNMHSDFDYDSEFCSDYLAKGRTVEMHSVSQSKSLFGWVHREFGVANIDWRRIEQPYQTIKLGVFIYKHVICCNDWDLMTEKSFTIYKRDRRRSKKSNAGDSQSMVVYSRKSIWVELVLD